MKEWLKDKYLVMAYNKYTFISDEFKERSFKYQTALDWFPIDIAGSMLYSFKVSITDTITDDNYIPSTHKNQTNPIYE